ncbi:hypothetical protein F4778DRAFT_700238 [Xylariomycetidae sp. FL2044]|nr:hypothetical protein F4778DRAFT_700238 [Xylariomycetidae sp. FL2044]
MNPTTHSCNCPLTAHPLPILIASTHLLPYSSSSFPPSLTNNIDPSAVPCADCQLATELGILEAIGAVHVGHESLLHVHTTTPVPPSPSSSPLRTPLPLPLIDYLILMILRRCPQRPDYDWPLIWREFARAFQSRRHHAAVGHPSKFLSSLALGRDLYLEREEDRRLMFEELLRAIGREAVEAYADWVREGLVVLVPDGWCDHLRALERDVEMMETVEDLERVLRDVDARTMEGGRGGN